MDGIDKMIYLDYSATTPVNPEVIDTYSKVCREFIGNPNSLHSLGVKSKQLIDASTKQIAELLGVKKEEIIWFFLKELEVKMVIKESCIFIPENKEFLKTDWSAIHKAALAGQ